MKNTKKRGFTIVELVIVIAVIAILASVLIPTFSGVVAKARESKNLQDARNAYTQALADHLDPNHTCTEGKHEIKLGEETWTVTFVGDTTDANIVNGTIKYHVTNGAFDAGEATTTAAAQPENPTGGGEGAGN